MKTVVFLLVLFCFFNIIFAQQKQVLIKDTTDSNSIVNKVQSIREIEVRSRMATANIKSGSSGLVIDVTELRKLPNIVGDADPFKALQYMGGISQAGDASANMNVRGGNNDQNLVILNGSYIQNPTHVLGLFSVFNPDLIDQMRYYKTGIPAEYGGRLSSVIDIKNFSNIPPKAHIDGSVGLISSRIALKVPLSKRFSLYASQRGSYIGAFVIPMLLKAGINEKLAQNDFEFSDTNAGFNYVITPSTKLTGHFYSGQDRIRISQSVKFAIDDNNSRWGNRVLGLQLNHVFSEKFSMAHAVNATEFYLQSNVNWLTTNYSLNSQNSVLNYKTDFIYLFKNHTFKTGLETSLNQTLPVKISQAVEAPEVPVPMSAFFKNSDVAWYIRDEWERGNLLLNIGLRAGINIAFPYNTTPDTEQIAKSMFYGGLEPRLFVRWLLDEQSSLKLTATRHFQYLSRVPVVNFGVPLEILVPVSVVGKPSSLWHFSGGYFRNIFDNKWELSAELYYKSFSNLIEYGGNLNDLFSEQQSLSKMFTGKGWAYGAEFLAKKNAGRFTGWLSYTLGWNYRQFDNINQGKPFFATNDRRHDFSVIGMYQLSDNINFSTTFVYATGSRLNLPRSWFVVDNKVVLEYSGYNSFLMPAYNRLDIAMNYKLKPIYNIKSELSFAIYNLYNRANPFQVYYNTYNVADSKDFKIKMSYLIPILPSISWTFHF